MPPFVLNLVIAGLILGMTYALMSEGLWGSALMFFNVLFAGIIAFNFYEPLAAMLATNVEFISGFADTLCLMALFIVALVMFRLTTETIAPAMVRFPPPVYHVGRIFFGLAGSLVTMAILLVAFETAPVHKKVFGVGRLRVQAALRAWASTTSGSGSSSTPPASSSPTTARASATRSRVRLGQGLRPEGRMAPEPPGRPPLRHRRLRDVPAPKRPHPARPAPRRSPARRAGGAAAGRGHRRPGRRRCSEAAGAGSFRAADRAAARRGAEGADFQEVEPDLVEAPTTCCWIL